MNGVNLVCTSGSICSWLNQICKDFNLVQCLFYTLKEFFNTFRDPLATCNAPVFIADKQIIVPSCLCAVDKSFNGVPRHLGILAQILLQKDTTHGLLFYSVEKLDRGQMGPKPLLSQLKHSLKLNFFKILHRSAALINMLQLSLAQPIIHLPLPRRPF